LRALDNWEVNSVDNLAVDNHAFRTQLIRGRSTGWTRFSTVVVILCTPEATRPGGTYPQKMPCLAFTSFTEKL